MEERNRGWLPVLGTHKRLFVAMTAIVSWLSGCVTQNCTVSSACLAQLRLQSETTTMMSGFTNISEAVLQCVGYQGEALRPLRVLLPLDTIDVVTELIPLFKNKTGFDVTPEYTTLETVGDTILDEATGRAFYDGWASDTRWVVDMAHQGMLEPLDSYITADPTLEWLDVHRYFRTASSVYNGSVIGVPGAGKISTLFYRSDVFAAAGLRAPNTWQELLHVARALNGSDFSGDGVGDYSICWQIHKPCIEQDVLIGQLLASMTQAQGTPSGWLFDLDTMQPTVNTPAFAAALELLQQFLPYSLPTPVCSFLVEAFIAGRCAMVIKWDEQFKVMQLWDQLFQQPFNPWKGNIGFVQVPGSTVVLDRSSGQLANCTKALCPYATLETALDGSQILVNRAPYSGISGISGFVNANSPPDYKKATYQLFAMISDYKFSLKQVVGMTPVGPFRTRHLSTSNASLAVWTAAGYSALDVTTFLSNMQTTLDNPNIALDVRINSGPRFRVALKQAVDLIVNGATPATAQAKTVAKFATITADVTKLMPMSVIADGYYAALNVPRRYVAPATHPPPSSPSPPPLPTQLASSAEGGGDGDMGLKTELAIIFGGVVPALVVIVLLGVYLSRSGRLSLFGFKATPGVGPDTTLLVTDIESSTLLWENLEQETMNRAMELHHSLVRKLLHKGCHMGYESATEGDSFILSFYTPQAALAFAQALQAALLNLDWPAELLACPLVETVWAKVQTRADVEGSQAAGGLRNKPPPGSPTAAGGSPTAVGILSWRLNASMTFADQLATANETNAAHQQTAPGPQSLEECKFNRANSVLPQTHTTAVALLRSQWTECGAPPDGQGSESTRLVHRGLRVRVGMHSGVQDARDVVRNKTTGRTQYSGRPLSIAKAVGDCGHGGMVLLSEGCIERIPPHKLIRLGKVIQMGDVAFIKDEGLAAMSVYQVVAPAMESRLPFLDPLLRAVQQMQVGALQAPVGQASIAFVNLVGASTLLAWNREVAQRAILMYQQRAVGLMQRTDLLDPTCREHAPSNGYVVELAGGLCLAAFHSPLPAVRWALNLVSELMEMDWEEELLQHELCEVLMIGERKISALPRQNSNGRSSHNTQRTDNTGTVARVLFRGPRLKIGIDTGAVHASLNPTTGRMAYRGRVMNRASRIAEKAGSGQVWCSAATWLPCQILPTDELGIESQPLGPFTLKGVAGQLDLMQLTLNHNHQEDKSSYQRCTSVANSLAMSLLDTRTSYVVPPSMRLPYLSTIAASGSAAVSRQLPGLEASLMASSDWISALTHTDDFGATQPYLIQHMATTTGTSRTLTAVVEASLPRADEAEIGFPGEDTARAVDSKDVDLGQSATYATVGGWASAEEMKGGAKSTSSWSQLQLASGAPSAPLPRLLNMNTAIRRPSIDRPSRSSTSWHHAAISTAGHGTRDALRQAPSRNSAATRAVVGAYTPHETPAALLPLTNASTRTSAHMFSSVLKGWAAPAASPVLQGLGIRSSSSGVASSRLRPVHGGPQGKEEAKEEEEEDEGHVGTFNGVAV